MRQLPNIAVIVKDGAIAGKLTTGGAVENTHARPVFLIAVRLSNSLLSIDIGSEIGDGHPRIVGAGNGVEDRIEDAGFEQAEMP